MTVVERLAFLLVRTRGRSLHVAVARFHRQVWLTHADFDLVALVSIPVFRLGIVAKWVLAAQFLGDSGEGLRQLRGVIGLVEPAAGFICQRVQVLIRSIVVGLARTRYRHASIQRSVVSLLSSSRAKGSPPGGNDGHASAAGALHRAQVISRVVLNWINERIEFFYFAQSALISGLITRGVVPVVVDHN